MTLTKAEQRFLSVQRHGRLATIAPDGTPQVKPVGFSYHRELGTIDITGMNMARSAKYKNVQSNPNVAFVADDVPARRVLAFNVDPDRPGLQARDVDGDAVYSARWPE
jgi:pyridoxamine 5'-phosphate oxidase family protein